MGAERIFSHTNPVGEAEKACPVPFVVPVVMFANPEPARVDKGKVMLKLGGFSVFSINFCLGYLTLSTIPATLKSPIVTPFP